MQEEIWIVDDERGILDTLKDILQDEGYVVETFCYAKDFLEKLKIKQPKALFLDLWLKDADGLEVLKEVKKFNPSIPIIIISGHGTIETAVKAIKIGAYDFIEKPLSYERIIVSLKNALKLASLEEENQRLRENIFGKVKLVGVSEAINQIREFILKVAPTDTTVLIQGESGVGKEVVARLIHLYSKRGKEAFVEVNCAALPETLIEAELFGYEKGAFTGAFTSKKGKLELAHKGTLFLDEVGDMSPLSQAKILRVIQEKKFERLGGTTPIQVDVRMIAATNKNLLEEIKKGTFREDLYYRLSAFPIYIPPLRERKEDIPVLVEEFLEELSYKTGTPKKRLSEDALNMLIEYDWPGNVRELKNLIERLVIITSKEEISVEDLPLDFKKLVRSKTFLKGDKDPWFRERNFRMAKILFEKEFLKRKLLEYGKNISKTAREIGIERSYLQRKIKEFGIVDELKNLKESD